jgi:hypothetical protein
MVSDGHVEGLFSAAFDGELGEDARASFDRHLAGCSACAAAFAELTTAVDALREMGPARMPRPVRLPEGVPGPRRRLLRLPARLPSGRGLVAGLAAVGMVAVAGGVAAVVVTGHLNAGVTTQSGAASHPGFSAPLSAGTAGAVPENPAACAAQACPNAATGPTSTPMPVPELAPACPAELQDTSAASAAEAPDGFSNQISKDDGTTRVVIATQAASFTPGETVDIYARVIVDSTGAVYVPCTVLAAPETTPSGGAEAASGAQTPATPVGGVSVGGVPVLEVVVPKSAMAGETFQVIAAVPTGLGETTAVQVSLPIGVT